MYYALLLRLRLFRQTTFSAPLKFIHKVTQINTFYNLKMASSNPVSVQMEPTSSQEPPIHSTPHGSKADSASLTTDLPDGGASVEDGAFTEDDGTHVTNVKKLKLRVNGFIDLSGLISNAAVLVLLLGQPTRDAFFIPLLVFILSAVCLQIALAVVLIIRHSFIEESHDEDGTPEEKDQLKDKSRDLLTASTILLMVISVFNVFVVAFAGVVQMSNTASTSGSQTTSAN